MSRPTARTKARRAALDLLFEAEQRGVNAVDLLEQRIAEPSGDIPPREHTDTLVRGVVSAGTRSTRR